MIDNRSSKYLKLRQKLSQATDKLGMKIDKGILDAVVIFNLLGFETTQSCEGHLDHGFISPWIQFGPKNTPYYQKLSKQAVKLYKANKDFVKIHQINDKISRLLKSQLLLLTEYLNKFYNHRKTANDQRLIIVNLTIAFQLICQGSQYQDIFSSEEKKEKLVLYRQEMQDFVTFLSLIGGSQ